jgi:20S proteasome subunit alpha 6
MARTYLEKNLDQFADCGRNELISHGLKALKDTLSQDKELTAENTTVGIVGVSSEGLGGKIENFKLYDGQGVIPLLEALDGAGTEANSGDSMEVDS